MRWLNVFAWVSYVEIKYLYFQSGYRLVAFLKEDLFSIFYVYLDYQLIIEY